MEFFITSTGEFCSSAFDHEGGIATDFFSYLKSKGKIFSIYNLISLEKLVCILRGKILKKITSFLGLEVKC